MHSSHFNNWQYKKTQNSASKFNLQKGEGKNSSRSCTHKGSAHLFSVCSNNNTVFLCRVSVLEKARCTLIWSTERLRINFRRSMVSPLKSAPFSVKNNFCLFNVLRYTNKIRKNRAHRQGYSSFPMTKFLTKLMLLLHPNFFRIMNIPYLQHYWNSTSQILWWNRWEKHEFVPVYPKQLYRVGRIISPHILNLGTKWRWVVIFTPQMFCPRQRTLLPIKHEAGWASELIWMFWRGEKSVASTGIQISYHPADSLLTTLTTLSQPPRWDKQIKWKFPALLMYSTIR